MSHIQYNCKFGQAAQAQKEVFEAIQLSKSFYFLQPGSLVQLIHGADRLANIRNIMSLEIGKKTRTNEIYTLANPFKVFCRKQ